MAWTELRIEMLTKLWTAGLSAAEIAREMGELTRSAVLGKVHRLELPERKLRGAIRRRPPVDHQTYIPRPRKRVRRIARINNHIEITGRFERALPRELAAAAIPLAQRKSLVELANNSCRWIYGDPADAEHFYCGAPEANLLAHQPYCRMHTIRACQESA